MNEKARISDESVKERVSKGKEDDRVKLRVFLVIWKTHRLNQPKMRKKKLLQNSWF